MANQNFTDIQLTHQRQMREKREALKQRKARTHRLIVRGAIAEAALGSADNMTDEQFQAALLMAMGKWKGTSPSSAGSSHEAPSKDPCGSNRR